jgi:hypothetical protein
MKTATALSEELSLQSIHTTLGFDFLRLFTIGFADAED